MFLDSIFRNFSTSSAYLGFSFYSGFLSSIFHVLRPTSNTLFHWLLKHSSNPVSFILPNFSNFHRLLHLTTLALTKTHEDQWNCEKIPCASMLTLLRGSNLSGLLTDENATRICSTTISQFAKSRRELSSCEATSLRLPPFFDLDTVTLASGGGAPLCVFQDPGVWIWDLHRTRSAMGWEGRGGWTKRCLYQVGRWFLGGRGAGVRCIRDKKRGPCTVSGARTPSIEREKGGRRILPVPFGYDRNENRKRGETTKYPLNSFHERR